MSQPDSEHDFYRERPKSDQGNLRLAIQIVIGVFIMIGAWFASEIWSGQKEQSKLFAMQFSELKNEIAKLDKAAAVTEANRFSTSDWTKANEQILSRFSAQDRRIDKHDDILDSINSSLKELKGAMTR